MCERRVDQCRRPGVVLRRSVPGYLEPLKTKHTSRVPDNCGRNDDDGKGYREGKDCDESERCDHDKAAALQCAPSDAHNSLENDRENRCLQSEEQGLHDAEMPQRGVGPTQDCKSNEPGQYKQYAGNDAPFDTVQQPTDVDRKFMRFGPRQQHAVIEGVQESLFPNPAFLFDENAVHDRNLPGGAAKAQSGNPSPDPGCVGQRRKAFWIAHRPCVTSDCSAFYPQPEALNCREIMLYLLLKAALSGAIVATVSEVAKRYPELGGSPGHQKKTLGR